MTRVTKLLFNESFILKKSLIVLKEVSTNIDFAIVENKPITLMDDYNLNNSVKRRTNPFKDLIHLPHLKYMEKCVSDYNP